MKFRKGVYIDGNYLVLNIRYPYDIELSRIDTPVKAYQWIVHLLEKNWVTRAVLSEMVSLLEEKFGYNLHDYSDIRNEGL